LRDFAQLAAISWAKTDFSALVTNLDDAIPNLSDQISTDATARGGPADRAIWSGVTLRRLFPAFRLPRRGSSVQQGIPRRTLKYWDSVSKIFSREDSHGNLENFEGFRRFKYEEILVGELIKQLDYLLTHFWSFGDTYRINLAQDRLYNYRFFLKLMRHVTKNGMARCISAGNVP
jgi:hypothetical protein